MSSRFRRGGAQILSYLTSTTNPPVPPPNAILGFAKRDLQGLAGAFFHSPDAGLREYSKMVEDGVTNLKVETTSMIPGIPDKLATIRGPGGARDTTNQYVFRILADIALDAATVGVPGGLDTGVFVTDTWYAVYVIGSDTDPAKVQSGVISASFTAPSFAEPGLVGYNHFRRVGTLRSQAGPVFRPMLTTGKGRLKRYMWDIPPSPDLFAVVGGAAPGPSPLDLRAKGLVGPGSDLWYGQVYSIFVAPPGAAISVRPTELTGFTPVGSIRTGGAHAAGGGFAAVTVEGAYCGDPAGPLPQLIDYFSEAPAAGLADIIVTGHSEEL